MPSMWVKQRCKIENRKSIAALWFRVWECVKCVPQFEYKYVVFFTCVCDLVGVTGTWFRTHKIFTDSMLGCSDVYIISCCTMFSLLCLCSVWSVGKRNSNFSILFFALFMNVSNSSTLFTSTQIYYAEYFRGRD